MLSRVADALYWMARYSERTQTNAHILQVQLLNMLEQSGKENEYIDHWEAVLNICASKEEYLTFYESIRVNPLIDYLLFSEKNCNALHATLRAVRENARVTRDSIPIELWELQNAFYLSLQQEIIGRERPIPLIVLNSFLQNIRKTSLTVTGLIEGSMDRDLPFYFIQVGKWLERAEKTIRMALIVLEQHKEVAISLIEADGTFLLDLSEATEAYSRKHRQTNLLCVIQYLLQDKHFPRSVMFCLQKLEESFSCLENDPLSARFLELHTPLKSLLFAMMNVDLWNITLEETILLMEERLCQCIDFGNTFATIYHLYEPSVQP
ncbi:alpha-E domain-containing protein [Lysinibacillus sp. G4S2]|uniref:alpha-E domain-containing protein n=1 Tax=Lysinibacillus sp. G4S2 TaxID=3055859 RepID=UPI0025A12E00|nr:alpha-E domain-containing protein [Lysinibacillus sp. G4S2]MDM5248388.1 alpha-E domain-containing protein [Lysinibacillus sp. G4S2]